MFFLYISFLFLLKSNISWRNKPIVELWRTCAWPIHVFIYLFIYLHALYLHLMTQQKKEGCVWVLANILSQMEEVTGLSAPYLIVAPVRTYFEVYRNVEGTPETIRFSWSDSSGYFNMALRSMGSGWKYAQ